MNVVKKVVRLLLPLAVLGGAFYASSVFAEADGESLGPGLVSGYTQDPIQNCTWGLCSDSWTKYTVGGDQTDAYLLVAHAHGYNNDGGWHCIDKQVTSVYSTGYVSLSDTYAWGDNPLGGSTAVVTTYHKGQILGYSPVDFYTSSDGDHSTYSWWSLGGQGC